ncbi:hypothetical protein [Clostridioides difficile]|uniref:Uncharacterized protein n=2 Tax=Clostridioides difficile TaxID=1496 RepID=A0AAX3H000_CLODI|nr:hypothetical protein [Clostridioides difficile]AVD36666.1 hypothetical protein C4E42_13410 [Clostridioides difficile]AVD39883.1 hypothetical protein C4E26_11195 [Clostridioides difficile]AVD43399.1 hypothetical protein C4E25_11205 [Clostridioides difficile]AXU70030.1 hypothetical protein CDIF29020_03797 [Clostridioides difficile]AXU92161.1 hypothetical protein CDIF29747_03710 [Clostridioides difficile]
MNEKPSFKQIEIILVVICLVFAHYNVRLTPEFIAIIIPLYLSYFIVSIIANQIAIKLLEIRQTREATSYNIGNG